MDAKERHELKDNDLAEFLENFGAFWEKRGNTISTVFFVAVAAWVLWYGLPVLNWHGLQQYRKTSAQSMERVWGDLWVISTPQGYRELARETEGYQAVPQLALLRGADAYHQQAIELGHEDADPESGLMSAEESLQSAESMYKQVLDAKKAEPVYRANAAVGLANVSETRGDFDTAKTYWTQAQQIAEEARLATIATQAGLRLELLDELAKPIVLADTPKTVADLSSSPDTQAPAADVPAEDTAEADTTSEPAIETPDASDTPDTPQAPADPGS